MLISKIKIGEFDLRITIEKNTPTRDSDTNEEVESWSALATVSAKEMVQNARFVGRETFEADQQVAVNQKRFLIRYSSDVSVINEMMRIVLDGDYYYITSIDKQKRSGWIMIGGERRDN